MTVRLGAKTWALLFVATIMALILAGMIKQAMDVAALQETLQRDWEISFTPPAEELPPPRLLPKFIDDQVQAYLFKRYRDGKDDSNKPTHSLNRDIIYRERFRALFRSPIHEIRIYDPEGFRGDVGSSLLRFPGLQVVYVGEWGAESAPTEDQWRLLAGRLRELRKLETLRLEGYLISDAAIAPLAHHPRLRSVSIDLAWGLTPACLKTFESLPSLTELNLIGKDREGNIWLTPEVRAHMHAVRPDVTLNALLK